MLTVDDERSKDIWGPAAQELLAALLLAAKACGGTMHDVYDWLNDEANPTPVEVLRGAGYRGIAASLAGTQGSPPETRGSVYFTARVAAKCLRNPEITAWITPPVEPIVTGPDGHPVRVEQFRPAEFPTSRQTLYLLSKDGGGSAGPLVAALTDRVMRAATLAAERAGGRLDPPMVVVLDEAANICRIADLPQLYSHLGSTRRHPADHPAVPRPRRRGVGRDRHAGAARRRHRQARRLRHRRRQLRRGPVPADR